MAVQEIKHQLPEQPKKINLREALKKGADRLTDLLFTQAEKSILEPLELLDTTWVGQYVISPALMRPTIYGLYFWTWATSHRTGVPLDNACFVGEKELVEWAEHQSKKSGMGVIMGIRNQGEALHPLRFKKTRLDDHLLGIYSTESPGVLANLMERLAMIQKAGRAGLGECFLGRVYVSQVKGSGSKDSDRNEDDHDLSVFVNLPPTNTPSQINPYLVEVKRLLRLSHEELHRELTDCDAARDDPRIPFQDPSI